MSVLRSLPTAPLALPVAVDCFEALSGRPVRQTFLRDVFVAVDRGGDLPLVAEIDVADYRGQVVRNDFVGAEGRTYVPFRTRYPRNGGHGVPPLGGIDRELQVAGAMLRNCEIWIVSLADAGGPEKTRSGPHRSTGDAVEMDAPARKAVRFDPSRWRLDGQGEDFLAAFDAFAFSKVHVGPRGAMIREDLPVWTVDPQYEGVVVRLRSSEDRGAWQASWDFAPSRREDAVRFQEVLARAGRRPAIPSIGDVVRIEPGWDRRDDLVEIAASLSKTHVRHLSEHVAGMPSEAARVWHGLMHGAAELASEGAPAARRQLASFVALRTMLAGSPDPQLAQWLHDSRRQAARLVEVEGIPVPAAPAPGPVP